MSNDYVRQVVGLLGHGLPDRDSSAAWEDLERSLGFEYPSDYKLILDLYAPIQLNSHLYLHYPNGGGWWDLGGWVSETVSEYDGVEDAEEGFPGVKLTGNPLVVPAFSLDHGYVGFLSRENFDSEWGIIIDSHGEFHRYGISFSEWLVRYLSGESVLGSGGADFYPGPVVLESLPAYPGESTVPYYGPPR